MAETETMEAPSGLASMAGELEKLMAVTSVAPTPPADETKQAPKTEAKTADAEQKDAKASPVDKNADAGLEDTTGFSPKASEKFNALKASRDTERTERAKLAEELKQLRQQLELSKKAAPAESEEMAAIRREHEELSQIVKVSKVEQHPRFKAYFEAKFAAAGAAAQAAAGAQNAPRVAEIIRMPEGQEKEDAVEALLSELPAYRANQLGAAFYEFQKIQQERSAEIAKASESLAALEAKSALQAKEQQAAMQTKQATFRKAAHDAAANLDGFKTIEGNDAHNAKVQTRKGFIDDFMNLKLDEKTVPMIPVLVGQALHLMESVLPAKNAEIEKLQKQVAQLTKATPGAASGDGGKGKAAGGATGEEGFADVFKRHMQSLGEQQQ